MEKMEKFEQLKMQVFSTFLVIKCMCHESIFLFSSTFLPVIMILLALWASIEVFVLDGLNSHDFNPLFQV
jgi:hypothetical protein